MQIAEQLSTALADRYVIKREIGRGGMATVYEAHDVRHDRSVALKVLNPDLGAVLGVTRFLEEIRVTANLQHPNLLPLFDSGEANGLLFYVMPYVTGESLGRRLAREKQLPIDEAVHIAASVAGALDYAHAHGVIHRDLKPENILLQAGQPMVADFGIALAVSKAAGERITQTGISLGTPQYMSPEQATDDSATPDALRSVVSQPWDGSSAPHELFRLPLDIHDVTIGPPHGYAAFTVNAFDVWITPVDTPQAARPLVVTAAFDGQPRLTRDGTLLAYSSGETGRPEVYVRPVLGPASRLQVSVAAGWQPVWSADGHYLYYRAPGYMMRAAIGRGSQLRVTRRDTLFRDDFAQHNMTNYDVFPDGKELLMIRAFPTRVHAGIILNWPELLRQRAAQRF